jgi:pyruvate dehydrogenase E2 component (dihydrolipoamide acetyltransferase)
MGGDIRMPKLGLTMTEGIVAQWLVAPGQRYERGEPILVVETDKIANEIEAPEPGTIDEIVVGEGGTAAVGEVLALLASDQVHAPATAAKAVALQDAPLVQSSESTPAPLVSDTIVLGRIVATPLARRLARQADIDLRTLTGSGPNGRIKAIDVTAAPAPLAAAAPTSRPAPVASPLPGVQARAAAAITVAKRDVPHFYLATEASADAILRQRKSLLARRDGPRITITHFLLLAMARALAAMPTANRVFTECGIVAFDEVDVGLAVSTPAGLFAPVLHDIGKIGLAAIARNTEDVTARTREGRLTVDDMRGGATSLSNAGMHDVTHMSSIIRPGHSSILGVGSVRQVFRPDASGAPALRNEIGLVLSCDHRLFDGVAGLAFLNQIKRFVENPIEAILL